MPNCALSSLFQERPKTLQNPYLFPVIWVCHRTEPRAYADPAQPCQAFYAQITASLMVNGEVFSTIPRRQRRYFLKNTPQPSVNQGRISFSEGLTEPPSTGQSGPCMANRTHSRDPLFRQNGSNQGRRHALPQIPSLISGRVLRPFSAAISTSAPTPSGSMVTNGSCSKMPWR